MPSEINMIPRAKNVKIFSPCIIFVKPYTPVTLNAAVHLMTDEWPYFLIIVCPFWKIKSSVIMACHNCHILQMTFPSLITNRTCLLYTSDAADEEDSVDL